MGRPSSITMRSIAVIARNLKSNWCGSVSKERYEKSWAARSWISLRATAANAICPFDERNAPSSAWIRELSIAPTEPTERRTVDRIVEGGGLLIRPEQGVPRRSHERTLRD